MVEMQRHSITTRAIDCSRTYQRTMRAIRAHTYACEHVCSPNTHEVANKHSVCVSHTHTHEHARIYNNIHDHIRELYTLPQNERAYPVTVHTITSAHLIQHSDDVLQAVAQVCTQ